MKHGHANLLDLPVSDVNTPLTQSDTVFDTLATKAAAIAIKALIAATVTSFVERSKKLGS